MQSVRILGIDLGTSYSCMAVIEGGKAVVIPNAEGGYTTPSVIAISEDGQSIVGGQAKRQASANPHSTVFSAKRLMGRKYEEIGQEATRLPYEVVKSKNNDTRVKIRDRIYSPPELISMILKKLKLDAEIYLGASVTRAVITVPSYFNENQRQATKDAAEIAGFDVERIINEPTAACIACIPDTNRDVTVAAVHFGGGTFDISILTIGKGVFEVMATNGDTQLGGDDFDQRITDWLLIEFKNEQGIDLSSDPMAMQRLREAAEKAKCELSSVPQAEIALPFITADLNGPKRLQMKLSRVKFESLTADLVERIVGPCNACLRDACLTWEEIDKVILVGGMTRMPAVQAKVKELFKREPRYSANPDEVVALGAAIQGGVLAGDVHDIMLLDVIPLSLGIEMVGGVMKKLITRNTTIPTRKSEIFSTAADDQTTVEIHVLQGEREMIQDNKSIGRFQLTGIARAPRGIPQIEVTFDIDTNSILNVSAKDRSTGHEQRVTINASGGLTEREIRDAKKRI